MTGYKTRLSFGAIIGFSLLFGVGSAILFVGGTFAYSSLLTGGKFLETPTAHGAWGPTTGSLVLLLGTPVAVVVGLVAGFLIAATRSRERY